MKKILLLLSFVFMFSFTVFASDVDDVKVYTQNLIDDAITKIFKSGISFEDRVVPFRKVLNDNFDFNYISKFVLGVYGRNIKDEQLQLFSKHFSELNVVSYVKKFDNYTDSKIEVIDVQKGKKEGQYFVSSKVKALKPGENDYSVDWRIVKIGDKYKVIDVIIEGISMVMSYKNEYSSILKLATDENKEPVEFLINKIEDKIIKIKLNK